MPRTLRHLNRTPWTDAERAIILRTGITEHQAAAELWAVLRVRRSASAVGVERRRVRSQNVRGEAATTAALKDEDHEHYR